MNKLITGSILFALFSLKLVAQQTTTAFVNATVIDVQTGRLLKDYTVLVSNSKIVSVKPSKQSIPGNQTRIVDVKGKFIMPGLWDMHVHCMDYPDFKNTGLALFVANGVTGIRDMGNDLNEWKEWQTLPSALITPRIISAGKILDGPRSGGNAPERIVVHNAKEGKQAVDTLASLKVDFIKVHDWIGEEAYKAIMQEAANKRMEVAGHVPVVMDARTVSNMGQKSIEHLGNTMGGFLVECSKKEAELRKERIKIAQSPFDGVAYSQSIKADKVNELTLYFDTTKAINLAKVLRKNQTWQTPTLTVFKNSVSILDSSFSHSPLFKYLPYDIQQYVKKSPTKWWSQFTVEDTLAWKRRFETNMTLTNILNKYDVPFLAGSDNGSHAKILPGFGLHEELTLLVQAGLTPLQSIQAATVNPAKYFGIGKKIGAIKPGYFADFIILNANPLSDIQNTKNIYGVVLNGRYFDRAQLDTLLQEIASKNILNH